MEEQNKSPKKKRSKKDPVVGNGDLPKGFEALAKLTSSAVVEQVKIGLSKIAPLEPEEPEPDGDGY